MFSAFVLVCTMMVDEKNCWVVHNDMFYSSYDECNRKVSGLINTGAFKHELEDDQVYDAMDYVCYNWKAKKI
jgi:hypothetical protein